MTSRPEVDMLLASRSMYRRMARNSALLASGTAVSSLITMFAVAIAARGLGARDFGVLILLQSAVLVLRAALSFSTQQPVIKLGSDAQAANDKKGLGEVISMGFMVDIAASVLSLAIAAFVIEASRGLIGLADRDVASAWIVAFSLLFASYPSSNGIFRLYDRFGLLTLIQSGSAAALLIAYGVLFAAKADLQAYVAAWAVYTAATGLIQLWVSLVLVRRDQVRFQFRMSLFSTPAGRSLLHYSWTTWGTSTIDAVRTNGDSLMVGAIVSVEGAALYNVARQLAGLVRKFTVVYNFTVFPEIARLSARRDGAGARRLRRRLLWVGLAVAVAGTGLAAVFGEVVIQLLFGLPFERAYLALVFLTAAAASHLISQSPLMFVQVYRGPRMALVLHTAATISFVLVAIPLTYQLSIVGMAIAQLTFGIALTLMCDFALRKVPDLALSSPLKLGLAAARYRLRSITAPRQRTSRRNRDPGE